MMPANWRSLWNYLEQTSDCGLKIHIEEQCIVSGGITKWRLSDNSFFYCENDTFSFYSPEEYNSKKQLKEFVIASVFEGKDLVQAMSECPCCNKYHRN